MNNSIVPLSRLALRLAAEEGMKNVTERLGLITCPTEYWETMADQPSSFINGYATCLNDVVNLLHNKGPLSNNRRGKAAKLNIRTLLSILNVLLYLCSYTLTQRESSKIEA